MYKINNMGHIALTVSDIERTIDFYQRVFGFKLTTKRTKEDLDCESFSEIVGVPGGRFFCAGFDAYGTVIEIVQYHREGRKEENRTQNYVGQVHLAFEADGDLEELYEHIKNNGAVMLSKGVITVTEGPLKGVRSFHCEDPDGFAFEFFNSGGSGFH